MMKTFINTAILLFSFSLCFSQNRTSIDSLKLLLSSATQDTSRVSSLFELSYRYANAYPDSALLYLQQALELSKKIGYEEGVAKSLDNLSFNNSVMGNWAKGLELATKGLAYSKEKKLQHYEVRFLSEIGFSYGKQGDFKSALSWYQKSIDLIKRGYPTTLVEEWGNYMESAYSLSQLNLADSALIMADTSLEIASRNNLVDSYKGYSYQRKANAYVKLGAFDLALENFNKSLELLTDVPFSIPEIQRDIAQMYFLKKDTILAEKYAFLAYKAVSNRNNPNVAIDVSEILMKIYDRKDKSKAYPYLKEYTELRDFIFNRYNFNQIYKIEFEEQRKQSEKEQEIVALKNKEQQNRLLLILGGLSILALVFYNSNRQKHKANIALEKTLSTLKSTQSQLIQSEKMASLGELTAGIAHEIQNPLNFVNNFSDVSNELIKEMKGEFRKGDVKEGFAIADDIEQNLGKINHHGKRASAIVKGMLEHSRTSTGIKEPTDINKLCDEFVRLSYHGLRAKDPKFNCDYKLDLDPNLPMINVVSQDIGRVLLNIINNAFQACSEKSGSLKLESQEDYKPLVTLTTKFSASSRRCEICISDNGPGIPPHIKDKIFQPFFTTKPTGQGTGLGLSLAYDIVKAHGGSITINSNYRPSEGETGVDPIEGEGLHTAQAGSDFVIQLPLI